jgi:glycosyltransferase involved in cell wall biosynthesis
MSVVGVPSSGAKAVVPTHGAVDAPVTSTARRILSGQAAWPYSRAGEDASPLPKAMPDGRPWPRISVVTPSFNQGRYIEETILSVLNQGYPNLEHLVIDGGSKDETLRVLDRYRDRMACVVCEPDKGQSDAINKGFARATGEIFTWLNSDDMLAPGSLAAVAMAQRLSGADVIAGICELYKAGALVQRHLTSCPDGALPLDDLLDLENCWLTGQFFYQPEVMFTRRIWEKAGGRVDVGAFYSMDYELWLRFAEHGARLKVIGRPVARYRVHEDQKTAAAVGYQSELPKVRDAFLARTGRTPAARPRERVKPKLRVAFFNDLGYSYGAGIAHRRIAESFATAGHEVVTVAAHLVNPGEPPPKVTGEDVVRRLSEVGESEPDLVVVGNMHGAEMDPGVLARIADKYPTAFVLHDLWLLTGRCPYPTGCRTYLTGCGSACACPKGYPALDELLVRPAWEAKRRVMWGERAPALLGDSRWVAEQVEDALEQDPTGHTGPGARRPIVDWIKYGFRMSLYRPRDRRVCRESLGLPQDKFIILSSASSIGDERKGLKHLARALELLDLPDTLVVCCGWFSPGETPPIPGMRALGYMTDSRELAELFSAVDLFVGPSLEEAFGQVFVEAAACGTPSVGYPVGGVPEALTNGVTGRLAAGVNPEALAEAIEELYLNPDLRRDLGRWGRIHVENEWSMEAAHHRFASVLRTCGVAGRIGLSRKIDFVIDAGGDGVGPPAPVRVASTVPGWRGVSGFDHWEGPYPAQGLPRCRWALGPVAKFELDTEKAGQARLLITCFNHEEGQRVRVLHRGVEVGEKNVPVVRSGAGHVLSFDVDLDAGANGFELHFWKWRWGGGGGGERAMAMLVSGIAAVAAGR